MKTHIPNIKRISILLYFVFGFLLISQSQELVEEENFPIDTLRLRSMMASATQVDMPQIIPSSPQSQVFEKYLNHEISEYNGLPNINIPLYEIEIKGMKIPITLSYHASGIKYKQYDGEVGVGWALSAGGYRVTRQINGKADEEYSMYDPNFLFNNIWTTPSNYFRDAYFAAIAFPDYLAGNLINRGTYSPLDGEYDRFSYMLPSTNGSFIITNRQNYTVKIFEENQDKILLNVQSQGAGQLNKMDNINITDNNGFIFSMGKQSYESTYEKAPRGGQATAWPLKRITSPFGETINFKYKHYDIQQTWTWSNWLDVSEHPLRTENSRLPVYINPTYPKLNSDSSLDAYGMCFIDVIESDKEKIEFKRQTIYNQNHILKEIIITNKFTNQTLKKIVFDYNVSPSNAQTSSRRHETWHLQLSSIKEYGQGSSSEKKYNFSYYAPPANITSLYSDQWGYYKRYGGSLGVPYDYYLHTEFQNDNIVYSVNGNEYITNRTLGWSMHKLTGIPPHFLNRSAQSDAVNYFSLKRITYPTGGYTEYEYENNKYKKHSDRVTGGGLRIKKITSKPDNNSDPVITEYKYGSGEDGYGVIGDIVPDIKQYFTNKTFFYIPYEVEGDPFFMSWVRMGNIKYSFKPLQEDTDLHFKISYPRVTAYQYNQRDDSYNGKTVTDYNIPTEFTTTEFRHGVELRWYTDKYYPGKKPRLSEKSYYDKDGNIVRKESYGYISSGSQEYEGFKIYQEHIYDDILYVCDESNPAGNGYWCAYSDGIHGFFNFGYYSIFSGTSFLSSKTVTTYDNGRIFTTSENYVYDSKYRLSKTRQINSTGGSLEKEFIYPTAGSTLDQKNMVSTVVETITKNNNVETGRIKNVYASGRVTPSSIQTKANGTGSFRTDLTFNKYDDKHNLVQYTRLDGVSVTYIYGYKYKYPIAEIINATYSDVTSHISTATLNAIATRIVPTDSDWSMLESLRSQLPKAQVSIYRYEPMKGISRITDSRGHITGFTYDNFGRLIETYYRDENGNKKQLETYKYNILNK